MAMIFIHSGDAKKDHASKEDQKEGWVQDRPIDGLHRFQIGQVNYFFRAGYYGYGPRVEETRG